MLIVEFLDNGERIGPSNGQVHHASIPWFDNASVLPVLVDLLCAGTCGAKIVTAATVTVCVIAWCLMLSTLMSLYSVALGFSHVGVMTMS